MSLRRKQALGRGLGALLGPRHPAPTTTVLPEIPEHHRPESAAEETFAQATDAELQHLPLALIDPNPRQPRTQFDQETLIELADSIHAHGVLQPILVAKAADSSGRFVLLAGERRLRASEIAGRESIPARVIEATEAERLEFALIENVQRENLDPVEEARAYEQLATVFGYSQEEIAARVGKSRVSIANSLRLLKLSEACLRDLQSGALTPGHARAILMLFHALQQEQLRREIVEQGLTVRQAEERARQIPAGEPEKPGPRPKKAAPEPQENLDVVALQEKLILELGCKVRVKARSRTTGALEIFYQSLDDLDRVLEKLGIHMDEG